VRSKFDEPTPVRVVFSDGTEIVTTALFERENANGFSVEFCTNIPYHYIIAEQERLLSHYSKEALRRKATPVELFWRPEPRTQ
jgi:hypothetical protein